MCTVTFIPSREKYFITSNRDEKNIRKEATVPAFYEISKNRLIYPRDGNAGGSWIGLNENGNAAVLLNGAFEKHVTAPCYRISRGKLFIDILAQANPVIHFHKVDLFQIEPFTLILLENKNLHECRWDGKKKHYNPLKNHRPYIWSSVTLYDQDIIKKREQWFAAFLNSNPHPTQNDILEFHQFTGDGDKENDLLMTRGNIYSTVSITSMLLTADRGSMKYLDIKANKIHEKKIELQTCVQA